MRTRTIYSTFIANTTAWGTDGEELSKGQLLRLLQYSVEQGIRSFKHVSAEITHEKEINLGIALSESGLDRREIQLISEYNAAAEADCSKQKICEFVDRTLINLKTEYLDLLLLKNCNAFSQELKETFEQLIFQGKIKEYGISTSEPLKFFESEMIPQVVELDFSLANYEEWQKCMAGLKDKPASIFLKDFTLEFFKIENKQMERIDVILNDLEVRYRANRKQLILSWMLHEYADVHLIINASEEPELRKNTDAPSILMDDWHYKRLKKEISNS